MITTKPYKLDIALNCFRDPDCQCMSCAHCDPYHECICNVEDVAANTCIYCSKDTYDGSKVTRSCQYFERKDDNGTALTQF